MALYLETQKRRSWQKLLNGLDRFLRPHINDGAILAISGGPDSRALLESVARWPGRMGKRIMIVTFDHGLRPESEAEAEFVLMRSLRLGFEAKRICLSFLGVRDEETLRNARYEELASITNKEKIPVVCTAHHASDNAEGYLMGLLGCGSSVAIEPVAIRDDMVLIRPFLELKKRDLIGALSMANYCDFAVDPSNGDGMNARAKIRRGLLPELTFHEPYIDDRLNLFAKRNRGLLRHLEQFADNILIKDDSQAFIDHHRTNDPEVIAMAITRALVYLCPKKDLRNLGKVIESIKRIYDLQALTGSTANQGLDRPFSGITVKGLKTRIFEVSGATIKLEAKGISITRI